MRFSLRRLYRPAFYAALFTVALLAGACGESDPESCEPDDANYPECLEG